MRINDDKVDDILEFKGVDNAGVAIFYLNNEPFTGIIESFYGNGNLRDEAEYTDGHIGGVQREYYSTGQLKSEYYKFYGRLHKYVKQWDESGNLIAHSVYEDGTKIEKII